MNRQTTRLDLADLHLQAQQEMRKFIGEWYLYFDLMQGENGNGIQGEQSGYMELNSPEHLRESLLRPAIGSAEPINQRSVPGAGPEDWQSESGL